MEFAAAGLGELAVGFFLVVGRGRRRALWESAIPGDDQGIEDEDEDEYD